MGNQTDSGTDCKTPSETWANYSVELFRIFFQKHNYNTKHFAQCNYLNPAEFWVYNVHLRTQVLYGDNQPTHINFSKLFELPIPCTRILHNHLNPAKYWVYKVHLQTEALYGDNQPTHQNLSKLIQNFLSYSVPKDFAQSSEPSRVLGLQCSSRNTSIIC